MAACRFYLRALRVSTKNSWKMMTRNCNTIVKITYCVMSVPRKSLIYLFKRFQTAMHFGKIDINYPFCYDELNSDYIVSLKKLH